MPQLTSPPPSRPPWQLVGLFLALAAVLIAAGVAYQLHRRATDRRQWAQTLATIADLKMRQIDEWRQDLVRDGVVLAHDPGLARLVSRVLREPADADA